MISQTVASQPLPWDFNGFRLLSRLGGGYISEVYLAEHIAMAPSNGLPPLVAIKIACDKSELYPREYTPELAVDIFQCQKEYLRITQNAGGHPLVIKGYPDALPDAPGTLVADAACTDLKELQRTLGSMKNADYIPVTAPLFKYAGASILTVLHFLHPFGIFYRDGYPHNTAIDKDFTLKAIDLGEVPGKADATKDARTTVASLYFLLTGDADAKFRDASWLRPRLSGSHWRAQHPLFFDMLLGMLDHESPTRTLEHAYWKSSEGGTVPVFRGSGTTSGMDLGNLAKAAYLSLPIASRGWLKSKGIEEDLVLKRGLPTCGDASP